MTDHQESANSGRKIRDRSLALLLVGTILLTPPVAGISLIDGKLAGIPVSLLYIFCVWAFLIFGAALLARPLRSTQPDDAETAEEDGAR